jgi:hypothetical protein
VTVIGIRNKTAMQVRTDINGFADRYVKDWEAWIATDLDMRPNLFGRILRKWQATRPIAMRRLQCEAKHKAPYLEDLLEQAAEPLRALRDLTVMTIANRTPAQSDALSTLWTIFSQLPQSGLSSSVGITKALLLLTDGRIGPAFDSQVRKKLGIGRLSTSVEWLRTLQDIGDDIASFELVNGPLTEAVPTRFARIAYGRLYDMALGPR